MNSAAVFFRCALLSGALLLGTLAAASDTPHWLPSTNHWAANTGGRGGTNANANVISNFIVDLAVLNAGDLNDQFAPLAPLVVTKSYWDETNWADGVYSAGVRVSKGEFFNNSIAFDSTTRDGLTATIAHPHVLDAQHDARDPNLTPQQRRDILQQNLEDQGCPLTAFPDNLPYVALGDGRTITAVAYPTGVAFDREGYLWIADNGPDQNFKIFSVPVSTTEQPALVATFGETGGVFAGPVPGRAGPLRFWGPRGVGFGDHGEIIVGCSGIPGQIQGGTDVRWFQPTDTASLAGRLATASLRHQARGTFLHVGDFAPGSNGTELHTECVRYAMDYTKPPGESWQFAAVTLDPFRYPDDPRFQMAFGTTYLKQIAGKKFLYCTNMVHDYIAVFRFEEGSEIAIPCALFYLFTDGQGASWAEGKYPAWDPATPDNARRRYLWRDANGDGRVDADEFGTYLVANRYSECYDIDADGNIWMGGGQAEYDAYFNAGGNWVIPCTGVDAHGVPLYDPATIEKHDLPQSLLQPVDYELSRSPCRIRYLAATDTLVIGVGFDPWYLRRIYVIDGYRRSGHPTLRCTIDPGFDSNGQTEIHLDQGTDMMVLPGSFAADNEYLYVGYLTGGRDARARGEITIYSLANGHEVGWLRPDPGTNWYCGAVDLLVGLQVTTRADGSRLICEEDDGAAKIMVFHWNPKDTGPVMQLQFVSTDQTQAKLVFGPTVSNRLYDVYASTELAASTWTKLTASPLAGTGGELEYTDTAAIGPRKFYRLQIVAPTAP